MASERADKNEVSKRVRAVQEWILQGQFTKDIIAQMCQLWGIGERAAYKYYNRAWTGIQQANGQSLEEKKAYHVQLRLKLLRDLKYKDIPNGARAALRIADSIARIDGIFPIRENQSGFGFDGAADEESEDGAIMRLENGTEIEI
jgi:hypothetical protein